MYKNLKEAFNKNFEVIITPAIINHIENYCIQWELHKKHPLTLNSVYIGIHKLSFLNSEDGQYLLGLFDTTIKEVAAVLKKTEGVEFKHNVASHPYNLFALWVYYKIVHSNVSAKQKHTACFCLLKMLQYKFFSGRIRIHFKHPPDQATMDYTLNELDNKFDIVKYGTWKKVIEAASLDIMDKKSIHYNALRTFATDKDVRDVVVNTFNKVSSRVKIIAQAWYRNKAHDRVITSSALTTEFEGKKIIKNISGIENMLSSIHSQIISGPAFIDHNDMEIVVSITRKISSEMLQRTLMQLSDVALQQARMDKHEAITKIKGYETIVSMRMLVNELLLVVYNACLLEKVNTKNPLRIIEKASNLMQSSQIKDLRVLRVKRSLDHFITELGISRRHATIVSLRSAVVIYLLLRSFKYMAN